MEINPKKTCPVTPTSPKTTYPKCSCCSKLVNKNHQKTLCSTCSHYVHKKCASLKSKDLPNIDWNNWDCPSCLGNKFPFTCAANDELCLLSFNSNFNCLCPQHISETPDNLNLLLRSHSDRDSPFLAEDIHEDHINFKYFGIHDFHKLKTDLDTKKTFWYFPY